MERKRIINTSLLIFYSLANKVSHKLFRYSFIDDLICIKRKFQQAFNKNLNLTNPKTFNEKLQWIKLFDRNPLYTQLVDKYGVRDFVRSRIGEVFLNQLLGTYDQVDEIEWDNLPDQFVLKLTHASGRNIVAHDKSNLNESEVKTKLKNWLQEDYYSKSREWPYKNVRPRIICEAYIPWDPQLGLVDYKIYCFNGKPTFIDVHYGRYTVHKSIFYDTEWNRQPFGLIPKETELDFVKPRKLSEMIDVAQALSENIPFCRVDLYYTEEKITFGEITFFPGGGFLPFKPERYNEVIGSLIVLPNQ